jgi:hypothetical protein
MIAELTFGLLIGCGEWNLAKSLGRESANFENKTNS